MAKKKTAAKKAANKPEKSFEESLWDTATKLRGSVESSEYKHVVLSLIFLKFVSDKFEERRAELLAEGKDDYIDMVEFYTMQNVFYLPETSRWSHIQQHAKQGDIAIKIDSALTDVEKSMPRSRAPCRTTTSPASGSMAASSPPSSMPSTISTRSRIRRRTRSAGSKNTSSASSLRPRANSGASSTPRNASSI